MEPLFRTLYHIVSQLKHRTGALDVMNSESRSLAYMLIAASDHTTLVVETTADAVTAPISSGSASRCVCRVTASVVELGLGLGGGCCCCGEV